MNQQKLREILNNGLILTYHTKDKMRAERITREDILTVLFSESTIKADNSTRNNKERAWNNKQHFTITYKGLTVVFCESLEHSCLICSVYNGLPHQYMSNPYNRIRRY